jgi:hypothetical protein
LIGEWRLDRDRQIARLIAHTGMKGAEKRGPSLDRLWRPSAYAGKSAAKKKIEILPAWFLRKPGLMA